MSPKLLSADQKKGEGMHQKNMASPKGASLRAIRSAEGDSVRGGVAWGSGTD
jgi:hypothetical protein